MAYAFTYEGTDYFLEFDRASVEMTEDALGLSVAELTSPKMSTHKKLFWGALLKHHPNVKQSTVEHLYQLQADKRSLFNALLAMYVDTYETLLEAPAEGEALTLRTI